MKITFLYLVLSFFTIFLKADLLKENFITFNFKGERPHLVVDFESDNLVKIIELDDNGNDIVSWKEIRRHKEEILDYLFSHLEVQVDQKRCPIRVEAFDVYRRVHQSYIKLDLTLLCAIPKEVIDLHYDLFFELDKEQKLFVKIADQNSSKPVVLSSRKIDAKLYLKQSSLWELFGNFLVEGIWHIWIGVDHVLFLLMLLLPSVYYYRNGYFYPKNRFKDVLVEVVKIVTAFSVAHSITLALSVTKLVVLDTRWVEVGIALSVLFTAVNNLYPLVTKGTWMMAFGFGLIHGFGFATVLHQLMQSQQNFTVMLLGFNLGVEVGQLAIVAVVLPVIFLLQKTTFYKHIILYGFSLFTALVATLWAVERMYGYDLLPF